MEDPILLLELLHEVLGEENAHYPNKGQISFDCPVCSHEIKGLNKGDGKGNFEVNYYLGLDEEAISAAAILGYNYNSSEWYERSYKVLNKNYKIVKKTDDKKRDGLLKRTIKDLLDR